MSRRIREISWLSASDRIEGGVALRCSCNNCGRLHRLAFSVFPETTCSYGVTRADVRSLGACRGKWTEYNDVSEASASNVVARSLLGHPGHHSYDTEHNGSRGRRKCDG